MKDNYKKGKGGKWVSLFLDICPVWSFSYIFWRAITFKNNVWEVKVCLSHIVFSRGRKMCTGTYVMVEVRIWNQTSTNKVFMKKYVFPKSNIIIFYYINGIYICLWTFKESRWASQYFERNWHKVENVAEVRTFPEPFFFILKNLNISCRVPVGRRSLACSFFYIRTSQFFILGK